MTQPNLKNNPSSSSLLKDTRVAKGLTLEIVHEATKVPMDALKAIEEGYSTRILTPFYYRGFIKIYAEFLGLDVQEVLKAYSVAEPVTKSVLKSNIKQVSAPAIPQPKRPNVFLERLGEFWRWFWTPRNRKNLLRLLAVVVALFVVVRMAGCMAQAIKSMAKKTTKASASVKVASKQDLKNQAPKTDKLKDEISTVTSSSQERKETSVAQLDRVTLAVRASRNSWIQVKADGKVVFQMTMKKGTVENWEAKKEIELSGRNIGDLNLEVNGKDVSPLGSFGRRVKRVLITKDGLSVQK